MLPPLPLPSTLPITQPPTCPQLPSPVFRGAAQGEGLGNAFLSHISAVDGIYHVCRAFEDVDVTHVEVRCMPPRPAPLLRVFIPFQLCVGREHEH
jgi:hypothetical protein